MYNGLPLLQYLIFSSVFYYFDLLFLTGNCSNNGYGIVKSNFFLVIYYSLGKEEKIKQI